MTKRKQHQPGFKVRFASEALKCKQTVSEPACRFGVCPTMIHQWKKALFEVASDVFQRGRVHAEPEANAAQIKEIDANAVDSDIRIFFAVSGTIS